MISKVIISDVEKKKKSQNWAGEFWMQEEKKKKEIHPEDMKDMQNGRQTAVL